MNAALMQTGSRTDCVGAEVNACMASSYTWALWLPIQIPRDSTQQLAQAQHVPFERQQASPQTLMPGDVVAGITGLES